MKIKITTLLLSSVLLTACATSSIQDYDYQNPLVSTKANKVLIADELVAYGKTQQPVKGYESAIAVAGKKNDYLLQAIDPRTETAIQFFPELLQKLSPEYLAIQSQPIITNAPDVPKQDLNTYHNIDLYIYKSLNPSEVLSSLQLVYYKPKKLVTDTEKEHLQQLDFKCNFDVSYLQDSPMYYCEKIIHVQILLAKKTKQTTALEQQFRQPVQMKFVVDQKNYNWSKAAVKSLYPAAVLFDIVTFPIQFGYILYKLQKEGIGGF